MPRLFAFAVAIVLALAGRGMGVRADQASETEIKAALITNILLFIQWPESRLAGEQVFHLCTVDGGALDQALTRSTGTKIQSAPIVLVPLDKALSRIGACEALFVGSDQPHTLARVATATRGLPILVIAEGERSLQGGAMLALVRIGNRMGFDINLSMLRGAGLTASSKLLRLARAVEE